MNFYGFYGFYGFWWYSLDDIFRDGKTPFSFLTVKVRMTMVNAL